MKKVVIIDYQLGNVFSIANACAKLGVVPVLSSSPDEIMSADAVILPGVGAFGNAMDDLKEKKLDVTIKDFAQTGKPIMGICLGMQLLFDYSLEFGKNAGLGLIKGSVEKFPEDFQGQTLKIPHIGWNKIYPQSADAWKGSPFQKLDSEAYVYFIHSFYVQPEDKKTALAQSNYCGFDFCSSVKFDNIFATQFHPEKSADVGSKILESWLNQISAT